MRGFSTAACYMLSFPVDMCLQPAKKLRTNRRQTRRQSKTDRRNVCLVVFFVSAFFWF